MTRFRKDGHGTLPNSSDYLIPIQLDPLRADGNRGIFSAGLLHQNHQLHPGSGAGAASREPQLYHGLAHRPVSMELDAPNSPFSAMPAPGSEPTTYADNPIHLANYDPNMADADLNSAHAAPSAPYGFPRAHSDPEPAAQGSPLPEQLLRDMYPDAPRPDASRLTQGNLLNHQPNNASTEVDLSETILPRDLHHMYDLQEHWSFFEQHSMRRVPNVELFANDDWETCQSSSSGNQSSLETLEFSKPGIRSGPLSDEIKQNAQNVRNIGSCLRCFVMRESCDTNYPCRNCHQKMSRSWKFGKKCIRPRLAQRSRYLLPEALTRQLKKDYVYHFINQRGWREQAKLFQIPLENGLGGRLEVSVREYLQPPGETPWGAAFLSETTVEGYRASEIREYDLPVVISGFSEHDAAQHIRHELARWFGITMQTLNDNDSKLAQWFDDEHQQFQQDIMNLIRGYYQSELINQHELLRIALGLSFFNYIFSHSFEIPQSEVDSVLEKMDRPPLVERHELTWVVPATINRYIKMLLRPPFADVAQKTLRGLEALLIETDNRSIWRKDIIFAVGFITVAHLGKTQEALIQLAAQPEPRRSTAMPVFTLGDAVTEVQRIEEEAIDVIITYLKQFMVPSARRKHYSSGSPSKARKPRVGDYDAETHAESFGFIQKINELKDRYVHTMPEQLNLDGSRPGVETFMAHNTHRVTWKYVKEVLADM